MPEYIKLPIFPNKLKTKAIQPDMLGIYFTPIDRVLAGGGYFQVCLWWDKQKTNANVTIREVTAKEKEVLGLKRSAFISARDVKEKREQEAKIKKITAKVRKAIADEPDVITIKILKNEESKNNTIQD